MALALQLAEQGLATTTPNPRVGCVLENAGQVVGQGWHHRAGSPHAEVNAIANAAGRAAGTTAWVSLEPCHHVGRTGPCTQALLDAGVTTVVAAMRDPDPRVSGAGLNALRQAGLQVRVGEMGRAALELNRGFVSRHQRKRPWVHAKVGMSLDGRTALENGQSQWITGAPARKQVQQMRSHSCALLTGVGTVLLDNPSLTVREGSLERQPLRVVLDTHLRSNPQSRVFETGGPVLLVTSVTDPQAFGPYQIRGVEILSLPQANGHVALLPLLEALAEQGINDLMVEAGETLNGALMEQGLVDEWTFFVAPMLLGSQARGVIRTPVLESLNDRFTLQPMSAAAVGDDWRLDYRNPESVAWLESMEEALCSPAS
jgi:diaminohydroxyphosphoribosylaminopyrimidine deaminase/5-amino-6-(5-phosphoribosylamino)uracil reductase